MYFGLTIEIMIGLILAYAKPINVVFGSRDNTFDHFGTVAIPFAIIIFLM
jgi:hypothetical protein